MLFNFFSVLVLWSAFITSGIAAVVQPRDELPVPEVNDIKDQFQDVPPNTSFFWSGSSPDKYFAAVYARNWIRDHGNSYKMMKDTWKNSTYPSLFMQSAGQGELFMHRASRAFAELASGKVYAMLPKGSGLNWYKGTHWDVDEWPALKDRVTSGEVTSIIRLFYSKDTDTYSEEDITPRRQHPAPDPLPSPPRRPLARRAGSSPIRRRAKHRRWADRRG